MKTIPRNTPLNGIDAKAQGSTIEAIRRNPNLGSVRFRAATRWTGGTRTTTTTEKFDAGGSTHPRVRSHATHTDMPLPFHGTDQAPAPAEIALHALASCLTSTLVYHCTARGINVRSVTAEVEGDLDASGFLRTDDDAIAGFESVRIKVHADTDANNEELQDMVDHAPMLDVFTRSIAVQAIVHSPA